jgi:HK97 family phage portal protein
LSNAIAALLGRSGGAVQTVSDNQGWTRLIDYFPGAWQQQAHPAFESLTASQAVFACGTLIAQDIAKMRPRLMALAPSGIWTEIQSPAFSPLLRKPNHYQGWIQFMQNWQHSLAYRGNTYILKERDARNVVVGLYPLHPDRVSTLVASRGDVFYRLQNDNLSGLGEEITVPATEIIHDRINCLHHPLVGLSPIYACGLAALQSLKIQRNSLTFFQNLSQPSGALTTEQRLSDEIAKDMSRQWHENYGRANVGKIAILSNGLKYTPLSVTAVDAQLIEQLKLTAEMICSTFHVPAYMIGMGILPPYNNIEALNQQYYAQCLQSLIGQAEACLDDGLELYDGRDSYCVRLDIKALLKMDTAARYKAHSDGILAGWLKPNEARADEDLPPVAGGDSCYLQMQNFSLAALAARDAAGPAPSTVAPPAQKPAKSSTPKSLRLERLEAAAEQLPATVDQLRREITVTRIQATDPSVARRLDDLEKALEARTYRGVWDSGETYVKENSVTWDSGVWIARRDTPGKPGVGDGWQLAVKRGDRGRDSRSNSR